MLAECFCIPFEFFSFLSKRLFFFFGPKSKQNSVLYSSSFKGKGKSWEWEVFSERGWDKTPGQDCEIQSFLRAPQNQLCLQLLTPPLILAVAFSARNGGASTPNLGLCFAVSSVVNAVLWGFASSVLQVESSNMNKYVYGDEECAKC